MDAVLHCYILDMQSFFLNPLHKNDLYIKEYGKPKPKIIWYFDLYHSKNFLNSTFWILFIIKVTGNNKSQPIHLTWIWHFYFSSLVIIILYVSLDHQTIMRWVWTEGEIGETFCSISIWLFFSLLVDLNKG